MIRRAVILLTLQYSILLLSLFAIFSGSVYVYMVHTFDTDYKHGISDNRNTNKANPTKAEDRGAQDATDIGIARLHDALLVSYGGLLVMVPLVSYALARRSLAPVIRSYNAQQQFVDNASHELRTPLSIIQGELELALSTKRSVGEYKKAIRASLQETDTLVKLISSLLLLARGTTKEVSGSLDEAKLQTCVARAVESIYTVYANSTPKIDNHMRQRPIVVTVMPDLFEKALINVLDNAVKFTPVTGTITIDTKINTSHVTLTVTDNGKGMDDNEVKHVFDRFWRAEDSQSVVGQGLGLPFAKQVIEAHYGKLSLASKLEQGTIVTISLPLKRDKLV